MKKIEKKVEKLSMIDAIEESGQKRELSF